MKGYILAYFFGTLVGAMDLKMIDRPMQCPEEYSYCKFSTFFNEGDVNKVGKHNKDRKILK